MGKLAESYKRYLFEMWKKKAYEADENRKIEEERERNRKINTMEPKSKMNTSSKVNNQRASALTFQSVELLK